MTTLYSRPAAVPAPRWNENDVSQMFFEIVRGGVPYSNPIEAIAVITAVARTLLAAEVIIDFWINEWTGGVQVMFKVETHDQPFSVVSLPY